ncbi:uncharacterized protein LOC119913282 isoform X2 [Micropterus salmoides]|uniref:uncharacterized protein LOC119913282 isoform X2 n=1 Tax=Micropterus salmoides TaxID=27706 RepID=UPI0018EE08FF|nr:uncharacterized protein LOC119913282 isoform X2 [Micropterus salmoides]
MSLQVCHCGWSKVTTYHGLRTHQGKMGCTKRGVKVESEQQYMWGNVGFTNNQKDLRLDVYASIKTDTTDYICSDLSLQVCHCGWSKVTTYHGLRTHQGKMGCTKRGVKVEKSEQQYMWGNVGFTNNQKDLRLDVYASIKTDTTDYICSDMSLQVCHCGWSKVTTYHGLRTHQGKMGCTKRGVKVESEQQYMWGNVGFTNNQKDLRLDVYASIKTDTTDYICSDLSLQVCHCGWSKVTTYHGLRTHQGKMGCTKRGVKVEKSEQQYMWGNVGFTNNQKDLRLDVYASIKTDTTDYICSDMSLQVCHCGWSKVTTYHGLRTHQGKMGCTKRGVKVEKSEQQYMWGNVGFTNNQKDLRLDVYASIKTDTTDYICSDLSLQVCHCGWSKVTTYHGLRTHQGKMGCTPKAASTPKKEQYVWTNEWEEVDERKHQPAKRMTVKKEDVLVSPSCNSVATIKEEPKSPLAIPQQPFRKDTNSRASHQLQDFSAGVQVNQSSRERPTAPPRAPVGHLKEQDRQDHTLSEMNRSVREHPTPTYPVTVVRPKEKDRKQQTPSQVKKLVRECPATTSPAAVVKPKKIYREDQTLSQARQERLKSELQQTIKERGENMSEIRPAERARESVPDSASTNTQTNSAAAEATTKEDQKSLCKTTHPDFSTGMKVRELVMTFSATTTQETAVRQKRKCREVTHLAQKLSATTTQETIKEQKPSQNVRESAAIQVNPASAEAIAEEDPTSSSETAQLSNFSTRVKVKELAWMFSTNTTQNTAVRPKGKHQEEQKVKRLTQTLSATTAQEGAVHPKEQEWEDKNLSQGSLNAEWLEINGVLSEVVRVVEDAKQKSADLSFSIRTFRATSSMMEQIRQKLEELASIELKWISKFAVDVKLDPTTANRCLVAADGKKVSSGGEKQEAPDAPGRSGSVLGLNRLTSGKSYWEAVVSKNTRWDLGVAKRDANRKEKLLLNPGNGYWVIAHYEDEKYAALTAPPVRLSLKEKPAKVGVFVDYEEGLVSFYDVTAQSHIYSFTDCSFTGEIYPYFSLHLVDGERADPLILSTVKHQ